MTFLTFDDEVLLKRTNRTFRTFKIGQNGQIGHFGHVKQQIENDDDCKKRRHGDDLYLAEKTAAIIEGIRKAFLLPINFFGGCLRENAYQAYLIKKLKRRFKGCFILKNDSSYLQGVPDLLILYKNKWAMLEVKPSSVFIPQPNQSYYIDLLDRMSFASFIFPEIEEDVLRDLQYAFSSRRSSRISRR